MKNTLKTTGIIFSSIFLLGYVLNIIFSLHRGESIKYSFASWVQLLSLSCVALFALSAFFDRLKMIQPAVFILCAPIAIIQEPDSLFGLGYFIIGLLLLERSGFFLKRRLLKIVALGVYLLATEIASVIISKSPIGDAILPTFFIASFCLFLWILYKDKLIIVMKEPKPALSLSEKSLSFAEKSFVRETLSGKSHKEIASEFELKESTVRNTLARAYKKLEVEDRVGLALIGERFDIVD